MRQVWLVLAIVLFLSGLSAWVHHVIYEQGVAAEKVRQEQAIKDLQTKQADLEAKYRAELNGVKTQLNQERANANRRLSEALSKPGPTLDWWSSDVPQPALDFAFGLSGDHPERVPSGPDQGAMRPESGLGAADPAADTRIRKIHKRGLGAGASGSP